MAERFFTKLIKQICNEKDIQVESLSFNMILKLKKKDEIRYIINNCFGFNSSTSDRLASDKYALYEVLKTEDIPVIEHNMIFNPYMRHKMMDEPTAFNQIEKLLEEYNNNIVIKSNEGCEGINVYHCKNYTDTMDIAKKLFKSKSSISICPFYNIKEEYRVIYLNGNSLVIYSKQRPYVIGNGINNIDELMIKYREELSEYVTIDKVEDVDLSYIPKENEKVLLTWKHNLYNGATPKVIEDEIKIKQLSDFAKKVAKVIGIDFATIDIIELEDENYMVLEVNSGVGMTIFSKNVENGYEIAKDIYSKAIDELFK